MITRGFDKEGVLLEPDYVRFKEDLLKVRPQQAICYFDGPGLLLDKRQSDEDLDQIAWLVYALVALDYGVCFQRKVDGVTQYLFKPRWKPVMQGDRQIGMRVALSPPGLKDAERLARSGQLVGVER